MERGNSVWPLTLLAAATALVVLLSALLGSEAVSPSAAWRSLWIDGDSLMRSIVLDVRLPRALSALAVGAMLAIAGTLLQALFRNPLADPFVLGVSGGASVGALCGMLLGAGAVLMQWSATAGALLAGLVVLFAGRGGGATRLLLAGVVIASACGALTSLMLSVGAGTQLRGMMFWLAGDLGWAARPGMDALIALASLCIVVLAGRWLNVLAAGELRGAAVGLAVGRARLAVFAFASALVAAAVLAAGPIGFVGLIAPHLARLWLATADHRRIAPAAALLGALLLGVADLLSRMLLAPQQLPVGALMALLGSPIFLWLLRRSATRQERLA